MIARSADGTAIAFKVLGDGPLCVLFMHGWAGSSAYWDDVLNELDLTGLRAVTYDLRGHGASDKGNGTFSYDTIVSDALAVADHVGARRVVLVGFSMSGKFAQFIACEHPDRVLGQILIAGAPACEIPFPVELRGDWSARAGHPERLREVTAAYITRPVSPEALDRWAAAAATVPASVLDESLRICTDISFAERLAVLDIPTLLVGGIHDPIFTPDLLRETMQSTIRGARLAVVDSNHEIPLEAPRELAGLITAFTAGLGRHDS